MNTDYGAQRILKCKAGQTLEREERCVTTGEPAQLKKCKKPSDAPLAINPLLNMPFK